MRSRTRHATAARSLPLAPLLLSLAGGSAACVDETNEESLSSAQAKTAEPIGDCPIVGARAFNADAPGKPGSCVRRTNFDRIMKRHIGWVVNATAGEVHLRTVDSRAVVTAGRKTAAFDATGCADVQLALDHYAGEEWAGTTTLRPNDWRWTVSQLFGEEGRTWIALQMTCANLPVLDRADYVPEPCTESHDDERPDEWHSIRIGGHRRRDETLLGGARPTHSQHLPVRLLA